MKTEDINLIPLQVENGVLNKKQAVNEICEFISLNYRIFGLQKYNEDFREDIIVDFLERGIYILDHYDKKRGGFLNYIYYYVSNLIQAKSRILAKKRVKEYIMIYEGIINFGEKEYKYKNINYNDFEFPKRTCIEDDITSDEIKKILENIKTDKNLLIIAIKSSFYIEDYQIEITCQHYNININDFLRIIQYCKKMMEKKYEKRKLLQERRNYAYFHKKKYEAQLRIINKSDFKKNDILLKRKIEKKKEIHCKRLKKINDGIENGKLLLRPTNKIISSITGLCEREVSYCISRSKKYFEEQFNPDDFIY